MINSIIIALLLLNSVKESHEMVGTGYLMQQMLQGCIGVGCRQWTHRPFGGRDLFQDVYDRVRPETAMDILNTMDIGRTTTTEDVVQEKKDDSRKPFGYDESKGWRKKKGSPTYISPDDIEYTEDKKHQNNKPGGHFDGVDPRTGEKVIEVGYDGTVLWPDGKKNRNKR